MNASSAFAASDSGLAPALAELLRLVQDSNLLALARFQVLRPAMNEFGRERVLALAKAMDTLDFTAAGALLQQMLTRKEGS